jgi:hypothetical protein
VDVVPKVSGVISVAFLFGGRNMPILRCPSTGLLDHSLEISVKFPDGCEPVSHLRITQCVDGDFSYNFDV